MRPGLYSFSKFSRLLVAGLIWISAVFVPLTPAGAQDISARFLADYGNVTVVEATGNFDENTSDGTSNVAPRQAVAKEFYRTHKDEYDFVVIFTNFDIIMNPNAIAFYSGVRNDVRGIGKQIYDNSSFYGSNGKLQGTIDMGNLLKLATNPLDPKFDFTVDIMMHETLHRWSAYVKFKDWNGTVSDALMGQDKAHWSFLLDSDGSTLYGNKWKVNGDGTFTSTAVRKYYSPLDLYLMGMIDKSKVPPTLLIDNPAIDPAKMPEIGSTINGTARYVNIDDIIAVQDQGERIPIAKDSQKQFKTAFIYVVAPGTFKSDDLPGIESVRNGYLTRFSILTDGKGLVQVASTILGDLATNPGIHPPVTVPRTLPPNINDGLSWLVNRQQADGSWTDFALTTERDTAESVTTLQIFPTAQSQFLTGLGWLGTNGSTTTDYLARRIEARVHAGSDSAALVQELLARRNSDGGWGGGRNFVSSPTDTAQALKALAAAGYSDLGVTGKAITYLQATQNADGGWSGDTSVSVIQPTTAVLSAYNSYRNKFDLEAGIGKGVIFLAAKQNSDGGFGNSPSTIYDSSMALMVLQSLNGDSANISRGVSYLLGRQSEDGSWNESPFQTALSMRAIWQATVDPDLSVKPEDISIIPATVITLPTNAVLSATIRNLGRSDVSQARVALFEGSVDSEHKLAEQTLAFPGQSAVTVTFSIPVTSASGHVYYVVADPDNQLNEPNKENNRAAKSLLPEITYDFQVLAGDIVVTPIPADIGKDVKIAVKVTNRGTSDAYNVPVRLFIDRMGSPVEISQLTVDLPAGGSASKEVTWRTSLVGVNLPLTVQIDPNNTFIETTKDNNKASIPLTVNSSILPNLSASYKDIVITPSPAREGGSASISVLVKNDGFSTAENVKVNIYKGAASNGGTLLGSQVIPVIAAGQAVRTTIDWSGISENGERIISVQVDPDNTAIEITKDDNFTFSTLDILSLPDLAVSPSSVTINPATPKSGDQVAVTVTVQNGGDQEAHDVTVQLKEGGTIIGSTVIPLVNGNSQATGTIAYSNSGQTGSHPITVTVDPDNSIVERTKDNNSAVKTFSIQDANLWLTEQYISPNGDGIKDSADFSFRLATPTKVSVQVINKNGVTVRTFSGGELDSTPGTTITWDGKNNSGSVVDDGTYQIKVVNANSAVLVSKSVEVDTNRSPLTEALGTKYLLQSNQTCALPYYTGLKWLPDESGLTFNLHRDANSAYSDGIYSMSPNGEDVLRLVPDLWNSISDPNVTYNLYTQDVSPDGQRIVFDRAKTAKTTTIAGYYYDWWSRTYVPYYNYEYSHSLWMVNTDGSNLTQLTDERQSAINTDNNGFTALKWSPDGSRIAVVDVSGLSVLNPETKVVSTPISGGSGYYSSTILWSQDGTKILAEYNNPLVLAIADVNGSGSLVSLGTNITYGSVIGWMTDNKILISAYDGNSYENQLMLFNPADRNIINSNVVNLDIYNTTISPNGRYAANLDKGWDAAITRITVVDSVGNVSVIAEHSRDENAPRFGEGNENITGIGVSGWSDDGTSLAFVDTRYDETDGHFYDDLVIYDVATGGSRRIKASNYSWYLDDYSYNDYSDGRVNQIIWMKDKIHFLIKTGAGAFMLNSVDASHSDFLPVGSSNFLELSPNERYLTYEQYDDSGSGCYSNKSYNQWATSSLLNLTADLRIAKSKTYVTLRGIASDKNFEGYRIEYADVKMPGTWSLVAPPSEIPVLNDAFTTWVPPYEGPFLVRLTVWDKAGNLAVDQKRLNWGNSSLITNLYKTEEHISPNGDGIKETVELHYRVLEPVHLEFNVYDSSNTLVRVFSRDHLDPTSDFISWDGKDSAGKVVPDGQYRISVFDYDFFVKVDSTLPSVAIAFDTLKIIKDSIGELHAKIDLLGHVTDSNIKKWLIEVGEGENPQRWDKFSEGNNEMVVVSGQGIKEETTLSSIYDLEIGGLKGKRFKITAEDFAGNHTSAMSEYVEERIVLSRLGMSKMLNTDAILRSSMGAGNEVVGFETVHLPTSRRVLQYMNNSQWHDSQAIDAGGSGGIFMMEWDTSPLNLQAISAIRIKVVDVIGGEHFSPQIFLINSEPFTVKVACDQSIAVHYEMPDALGSMTLQLSRDRGATWNDVTNRSYSNAYLVDDAFVVPQDQFNASDFNQLAVRVVAKANNGVFHTSGGNPFPIQCKDISLNISAAYEEATTCNSLSPGKAKVDVNVLTDGYTLQSLKVTMKAQEGEKLLQDFGQSNNGSVIVDTSSLPEGRYPVTATAAYSYVLMGKVYQEEMKSAAVIIVNRILPQAHFAYPSGTNLTMCPDKYIDSKGDSRYGVSIEGIADSFVGISHYDVYRGAGADPVDWAKASKIHINLNDHAFDPIIHGKKGVKGSIDTWDVTGYKGNTYALQLRATDTVGNLSCTSTSFYLNEPVRVASIAPDRQLISSAKGDAVGAGYQLTGPAIVGIQVFPVLNSPGQPDTLSTPASRNIAGGIRYISGIENTSWDGRNDGGTILPDGKYGLTLNSIDACQLTDTKWANIEIDNTMPVAAISYPSSIDPLPSGNIIEIKGTATDSHFKSFLLEAGEGTSPSVWKPISRKTIPVLNDKFTVWNTYGLKDQWTLRLTVDDAAGNISVTTSTINLGTRKELIKTFTISPDNFSPNGDQKRDTTRIDYEVTDACQIRVDVINASGTTIKTFIASTPAAGTGSFDWDGKINLKDTAADGSYTVSMRATLTGKPEVFQTENLSLTLDTVAPQVIIPVPSDKAYYNKTQMPIIGSITDPNLVSYSASVTGPTGTTILDTGNQNRTGYTFGSLFDMTEDTYTLAVDASDRGENQTKSIRSFTIDRTPPKATLDTPKNGEFYGNSKNVIDISGAIVEKNLERYSLRYGVGETPTEWKEVFGGDAAPTVSKLFSWKVGKNDGIADGIYTLSLYAKDKAGLEGETKVKVVVDNTQPEVAISRPINGGYLTKATDFKGTLSDTNLDKGLLELSGGGCATATKWAVFKTITTSVRDGVLDSWTLLPADGEYCLRISATDKSGNQAETRIGLKIDTHPPTPPQLTGKTENKTTNSLSWTKSAESDVASYNVYRTGQKLNAAPITAELVYSDADLKEGSYIYTVKAVDLAGNESDSSNTVSLKIDLAGPTVRISTPKDGAALSNLIDIKGTAYSQDDFKEYRVYIGQGSTPSSWTLIRRSPLPISYGSLAQWDTIGNLDGSQYTLKLEGEDTSGNISTTQAIFTIDNTPPRAPVLVSAVGNNADVALTWKANAGSIIEGDLAGYLLYRNDQLANVAGIVAGNLKPYLVTGAAYTDKALPDGIYRYYLVAMDQAGNSSDQSNTLEVDIDTHPPHLAITTPTNGQNFDGKLMINAETPDNDIATVQFQYKQPQDSTWTNLGQQLLKSPYVTYFDPRGINRPYGDYQLRVLSTDRHNNVDPAPSVVTVTYTDLTPPDVPSNLTAKVNGADVALTWNAVSEAAASYTIYRWNAGIKSTVSSVPVKTASFVDAGVPDGTYQYEITALDISGNESAASGQATAKIYAPIIIQPYTPVKEPALNLTGNGVDPNSAVEITTVQPSGDSAKVTVFADASGNFKLDGIALALGETSFSAVTSDSNGNVSKNSEAVFIAYGKSPAVPTGLVSTVQGNGVTLNWNANSEPDILGYFIYRDGEPLNYWNWVEPIQASASNEDYYSPAANAIDGYYDTYWSSSSSSDGTFTPVWWQMTLPAPELISELDLVWQLDWNYNGNEILYAGKDFDVQAWSGHNWVTIKKVVGNDQQYSELIIDPPYRTDRLRLLITATTDPNFSRQIKLADANAYADDINSSPSYNDTYIPDGKYRYEVSAVNQYGYVSDKAATNATIGAFPQAPSGLVATVQGSDVTLNWNPNPTSDSVYYYNVQRWNGQVMENYRWVSVDNPSFTDYGTPNGTYHYRVSALANGSNGWLESDFSVDAFATVAVVPPSAPPAPSVISLPVGKSLKVSWQSDNAVKYYSVYRGTVSAGSYIRVASWVSSTSYVDTSLVNGEQYFYVITADDDLGNSSGYSGEASGIPRDLIAQVPTIFQPTVLGAPVTVYEGSVKVSGFAEPGAQVSVLREDAQIGSTIAVPQDIYQDQVADLSAGNFSLSPDGNTLSYINNDNLILQNMLDNTQTTITTADGLRYLYNGSTPIWSPSGRYLVLQGSDTIGNSRVVLYDRDTDVMQTISTGAASYDYDASWSPKGDAVVFVSDGESIWLANPTDGTATRITDVSNYAYSPRLSPDGRRVAFSDDNSALYVFNRDDNSFTLVDDDTDGWISVWSPDGSHLAFTSYRDGNGDIYTYDLASGLTSRRTNKQQDGGFIAWSPDGTQLGFATYSDNFEMYWIVDINGHERKVFDVNGELSCAPEWRSSGALSLIDSQGIHSITPAGYFSIPQVYLAPGENHLAAIEIDEAGNVSNPSDSIIVGFDTGNLSDLVINDSDVLLFPPYPKPGEEVVVTARVHNPTNNSMDSATVELYLWDGSNDVTLLKSEIIPHMDANGEASVSTRYNIGTAVGTHTFIAVADPANLIKEVLETNNYASKDLIVTDQEKVTINSSLNASQYAANQNLYASVKLRNSGLQKTGMLYVAVEDAAGNPVKILASQTTELPYGADVSLAYVWDTSSTFSGTYRLHATVRDGSTLLAEDVTPFTILPDLKVSAGIVTDRQQYGSSQDVGISTSFINSASNYLIPQLKAKVRVLDAQNIQMFSGEKSSSNLMPGMSGTLDFAWNTGLSTPGAYTSKVDYYVGEQLVGSASASFGLIPSVSVTGSIKTESNVIQVGGAITAAFTLINSGNANATGQAIISLVDPDTFLTVFSSEQAVTIPMGGSQSGAAVFTSNTLPLKTYLVTLNYASQGSRTPIGSASVSIKDGMPPVLTTISPREGEKYTGDVNFSVTASDDSSGVARVEYALDGISWNQLPPADQSAGRYGFAWKPAAVESGPHSVSFRGTDRAGNTSSPLSVSFVVSAGDTIPPVLNVSTLADGSLTNNQILNIAGTVSDDTGVKEVTVNGAIVTINADGSFSYAQQFISGPNRVEIKAADLADNQVSNIRTINLDQRAPLLTIVTPADNSKTGAALMEVTGIVDETSAVTVKVGEILQTTLMNGNGFASSVTLVPGINTIEVTATDLANNTGSQKRTVIYDDQKPSLAITEPGQDIRTNQSSLIVRGTVSDLYTAVVVAIFMDGQTFNPVVTDGHFEQAFSFSAEKSYAIVVTATNEVGSTTSTQRNVVYDITPPAVSIDPVTSPTAQSAQSVSGTREEGSTVAVSCATATVGDIEYPTDITWRVVLRGFSAADNSIIVTAADAFGNLSTATAHIIYDTIPPSGIIVVNGGVGITASLQATLSLAASDESGVSQMRFSNDGSVWSDPENYATTRGWFLTNGDGLKRVYVTYQDLAGNWSEKPIVAEIALDTMPPVVSVSPAGGVYNGARGVTLTANEAAVIHYTDDGSAPTGTSAVYQTPIQVASSTTLRFMAIDTIGNRSDVKTEIYVIDTVPPSLTVSTLADGSYTNNQVLNIAGISTDSSGISSLVINGVAATQNPDGNFSQALVLQPGPNVITVVATDLVGNSSTDSRTINLDMTAPQLTVITPADNAKTASAILNVTGVVDETSTVTVKLGASVQQSAMTDTGFSSSISLIPGINTIYVTATDLAGNTSAQKRTVVYDDQKPSLAITDPPQDIRTNQSVLVLRGTVSDLYTQVGVIATMDGKSYTPQVVDGAFEQQLSFTQEKSYAIVVTATNEVENSTTTQRNVIYDITPPTLTINPLQSPTAASSVLISGTRETDVAVSIACSTATVGTILYPTTSSWQVQLSTMQHGEHFVIAQSTDAANNTSTASAIIVVQQSGPDIVLSPSPTIIWPPNHKMVPVTINGVLNVPPSDIKSLGISLADEYGEYNFSNLTLGSIVLLEAWRHGNDLDGRKYTFTAILTLKDGSKATATAVVLVPHDMSGDGSCGDKTDNTDDNHHQIHEHHNNDDQIHEHHNNDEHNNNHEHSKNYEHNEEVDKSEMDR